MSRFGADLLARALAAVRSTPAPAPAPAAPSQAPHALSAIGVAAALCRRFEGLHLEPYLDPVGIPTIGYGATFYEDGRRVTLKDPPITKERAEQLLQWHLRRHFLPDVAALCPGADTPNRIGALLDFTFNLGAGNLRSSTLRRKVNAGHWDEVPAQLMRWNKAGGRVLRGLTRRRQAEIDVL
ncbi:lysozyme [Hydrogenophaga sp.]|uniref:lysozyme n=1 Tax=Hydrogenophaga sp. TaxID=1904254 RepID=UPI002730D195|nr:lysozyme [Hydrogenophaga sp.]MDP2072971.1 lysozyme [Hydrogenophaga sp.]MDP3351796.1 lysozyme [Hydrogenophaga sp.]